MKLYELIDRDELASAIVNKHVKAQYHKTEPLAILNYTQTCMWDRAWTETTMLCRGLIYRTDTEEIVARAFRKFFNYGEPEAPQIDLTDMVVATDKVDGSLGILYPCPKRGGYAIATRGAFHSEQAEHASRLWYQRYGWAPPEGVTALFEIVYPGNRIVLDYGDLDDLICLGTVSIATGGNVRNDWPGAKAKTLPYSNVAQSISATPRKNAEGMVLAFPVTGHRVKLKQADYIALHRVMTNTSPRKLWEYLAVEACKVLIDNPKHWAGRLGISPERAAGIVATGEDWRERMLAGVPDEFFAWCKKALADIEAAAQAVRAEVLDAFASLPQDVDRKAIAAHLEGHAHKVAVFNLLAGKEIDTHCWRAVYPSAGDGWLARSEDVA
jgi:RNA ligase